MLAFKSLLCLALTTLVSASPIQSSEKRQEAPVVTYLGTQGPILSSGASTTSKGLVYTAGTVPSFNGSIVEGGIGPQTVRLPYTFAVSLSIPDQEFHWHRKRQAQVINNIGAILEEAGTSWSYVLKTTIFLASMDDYAAVNEVYGEMLPDPKPARTAVEVGKLPGDFLIEIEAIAAIPDC
jgi:reactive intermediate/imine deaminase